jgi:AcrR family transcriptional regulator
MTRKRNPRGQGERLRDDIIEAASRLLADPAAPPLTLRAVAREVGVAATSVYLHFDSIDTLTLATVNHLFAELIRRQDALTETDPCERVLAGALVYCEFGLAAPGQPAHLPLQVPLAAAGADRPRRRRRPPSHIQNH